MITHTCQVCRKPLPNPREGIAVCHRSACRNKAANLPSAPKPGAKKKPSKIPRLQALVSGETIPPK